MTGEGPVLSNRLTVLAHEIGEAVGNYRRGSIDAIRAYLAAGRLLAEARAECRRGQWGPFLARAGVGERAARDMVRVARAVEADGVDAVRLHEAGGVRAWMMGRANPAAVAIVHRQAFDPVSAGETPAPGAAFEAGHATDDMADNARKRPSVGGEAAPARLPGSPSERSTTVGSGREERSLAHETTFMRGRTRRRARERAGRCEFGRDRHRGPTSRRARSDRERGAEREPARGRA